MSMSGPLSGPLSFRPSSALTRAQGGGASGPWYNANAFELDLINNRRALFGVEYADDTALFTALKGADSTATASLTSGRYTIGDYVSTGITEELLDGTFDTGTGWTPNQSSGGPATLEIAPPTAGHIVSNGATNPRIDQKINPIKGKAYRVVGTVGRGTTALGIQLGVGMTSGFGTPISQSSLTPSTNTYRNNFTPAGSSDAPDTYIGAKTSGAPAGTLYATVDNFTVKECWPFEGYQQGFVSCRIYFTSMATGTGTFYLLSFDDNAVNGSTAIERNYIRLAEVNGVMQLIVNREVTPGSTTNLFTLNLGAVSPSTDHYIDLAVAPGFSAASMDGGAPVNSIVTNIPGVSHMRLHYGRSTASNLWDNTNTRLTLYNTLIYPAGASPASFVNFGDSYGRVGGYIKNVTGLIMRDQSSGGLELQAIYNKVVAHPELMGLPTMFWDGKPNGNPSTQVDYKNMIEACGNLIGWSNLVIAGPVKTIIGSGENAGIDARAADIAALVGLHGGYFIDAQAILAAHGDGSAGDNAAIAAGVAPPSLLEPDGVHINAAGNNWVVGGAAVTGTIAKAFKDMGAW